MNKKMAIIGAGNMGVALLKGLLHHGWARDAITLTRQDAEKLAELRHTFGVEVTTNNAHAVESADIVILAVKPQRMHLVAAEIQTAIAIKKPLIISIAAGTTCQSLAAWLGSDIPLVRAMPNVAAALGLSATALYAAAVVSQSKRDQAEIVLSTIGETIWLDNEHDLATVTALSGSGPAFIFLMMQAMQEAAINLGLDEPTARKLTLQTALGAATIAQHSNSTLAKLIQQVASPRGTTEAGLDVLENKGMRALMLATLKAAKERAEALALNQEKS